MCDCPRESGRAADHDEGQCIRFPADEVRVFKGRNSMGVRGICLAEGDRVISLSILPHFDAAGRARAYLKMRRAIARRDEGERPPSPRRGGRLENGEQLRRAQFGNGGAPSSTS